MRYDDYDLYLISRITSILIFAVLTIFYSSAYFLRWVSNPGYAFFLQERCSTSKKREMQSIRLLRNLKLGINHVGKDGIIFTLKPGLGLQEKEEELRSKSIKLLHQSFLDQLSALLGQENTNSRIEILHEILQNQVVLICI